MLNLTLVNKENQFQGLFDNPTDLRFFEYDFHGQKKVRELLYRDETRRLTLNRKALSKKKWQFVKISVLDNYTLLYKFRTTESFFNLFSMANNYGE